MDGLNKLIETAAEGNVKISNEIFCRSKEYTDQHYGTLFFLIRELMNKEGMSAEKWDALMDLAVKFGNDSAEVAKLSRMFNKPCKPENIEGGVT
jgi:hypothetical protein